MDTKTLGKLLLIQPNNYPHQDHDHEGGIGVDVCVPEVFIPVTEYPGPSVACQYPCLTPSIHPLPFGVCRYPCLTPSIHPLPLLCTRQLKIHNEESLLFIRAQRIVVYHKIMTEEDIGNWSERRCADGV